MMFALSGKGCRLRHDAASLMMRACGHMGANIAALRHKVAQHHFGAQRRNIISRRWRRHHF